MHNLEVLKAATQNSAETLRKPDLGLVHPGYKADLVIVDGNPAYNLRFLYSFGALRLDDDGEMIRTDGIVHTIKDGIVIENDRLMEAVADMVARSKEGVGPNVMEAPFVPEARRTTFDESPSGN
jgi:adenine deaminase